MRTGRVVVAGERAWIKHYAWKGESDSVLGAVDAMLSGDG
jgi:hypothetical protein